MVFNIGDYAWVEGLIILVCGGECRVPCGFRIVEVVRVVRVVLNFFNFSNFSNFFKFFQFYNLS